MHALLVKRQNALTHHYTIPPMATWFSLTDIFSYNFNSRGKAQRVANRWSIVQNSSSKICYNKVKDGTTAFESTNQGLVQRFGKVSIIKPKWCSLVAGHELYSRRSSFSPSTTTVTLRGNGRSSRTVVHTL